jgi:hypothetical protein
VEAEVERINRVIRSARRGDSVPEYDVALSYASEERDYVEKVSAALQRSGIRVFYDKDPKEDPRIFGKDLLQYLSEIYGKRARYTVMFISESYARKRWTVEESRRAQALAFVENRDSILPVKFDETEIPGLLPTVSYRRAAKLSPEQLAELVRQKVKSENI